MYWLSGNLRRVTASLYLNNENSLFGRDWLWDVATVLICSFGFLTTGAIA